jgi:hypothetical protein
MIVAQGHFEDIWVIPMTDILHDILHELNVVDVSLPTSREVLLSMPAKQSNKTPQYVQQQKAAPEQKDQASSGGVKRMPERREFDVMRAQEAKRQAEARPSESKTDGPSSRPKQYGSAAHRQFEFVPKRPNWYPIPRLQLESQLDDESTDEWRTLEAELAKQKSEGKQDNVSAHERRARILEAELAAQDKAEKQELAPRRAQKATLPQQGLMWQSRYETMNAKNPEDRPGRSHKTEQTKSKETGKEKLTRMVREHAALQRELGIRRLSDLSQADTLINARTPSEGSSGQLSRPNTAHLSWADSLFLSFDSGDEESADSRTGLEPEVQAYLSAPSNIGTPQMAMATRRQRREAKEQKTAEASKNMTARQQEKSAELPPLPPLEGEVHVSSADSLYNQFREELAM